MAQECLASWKSPIMIGATFGGFFIVIGLNMTIEAFVMSYNSEMVTDESSESLFVDGPIMMGIGFISVFVGGLGSCRKFRQQRGRSGSVSGERGTSTDGAERTQTTSISSSLPEVSTRPVTAPKETKPIKKSQPQSSTVRETPINLADLADLGVTNRSTADGEHTKGPKRSISGEIAELCRDRRKSLTLPRPIPLPIFEEELEDDVFKSDSSSNVNNLKQLVPSPRLASYKIQETSLNSTNVNNCRRSETVEGLSRAKHPPRKVLKTRMTSDDVLLALCSNYRSKYDDFGDRPSLSGTSQGSLRQVSYSGHRRPRDSGYVPSDSSRSGPEPRDILGRKIQRQHVERQAYSDSETSSIFSLETELVRKDKPGSYDDIVESSRSSWNYETEPKLSPVQGGSAIFKKSKTPDDVSKRWVQSMTPHGRAVSSKKTCKLKSREVTQLTASNLPQTSSSGPSLSPTSPTPLLPFRKSIFQFPDPTKLASGGPRTKDSDYTSPNTSTDHSKMGFHSGYLGESSPKQTRDARSNAQSRYTGQTAGVSASAKYINKKGVQQRMPVTEIGPAGSVRSRESMRRTQVDADVFGSLGGSQRIPTARNKHLSGRISRTESSPRRTAKRKQKAAMTTELLQSSARRSRTISGSTTGPEFDSCQLSTDGDDMLRSVTPGNRSSPSKSGRHTPKHPHLIYPRRTPKSGRRQLPDLEMCRRRAACSPDGAPHSGSRGKPRDIIDDEVMQITLATSDMAENPLERQDTLPWV